MYKCVCVWYQLCSSASGDQLCLCVYMRVWGKPLQESGSGASEFLIQSWICLIHMKYQGENIKLKCQFNTINMQILS